MIKLKDILFENSPPNLLIPRRLEGRVEKYIQAKIQKYIKDGGVGHLDLRGLNLIKLPSNLKNIVVDGYFYCSSKKLTLLQGAPSSVGRGFYCYGNKLTSLDGAPTSVGGDFYCGSNTKKFTEDEVRVVCSVKGEIII